MKVFIDMDGVLADFYAGVCRAFGVEPWPYGCKGGKWEFYEDWGVRAADVALR